MTIVVDRLDQVVDVLQGQSHAVILQEHVRLALPWRLTSNGDSGYHIDGQEDAEHDGSDWTHYSSAKIRTSRLSYIGPFYQMD